MNINIYYLVHNSATSINMTAAGKKNHKSSTPLIFLIKGDFPKHRNPCAWICVRHNLCCNSIPRTPS